MPVYEILLRQTNVPQQVSFATREDTAIGDLLTFDSSRWIVVGKEPPFEQRRIERLICHPADALPPGQLSQ